MILLLLAMLAGVAHAAPVVVDDRAIELPAPAGYCPLDRGRVPDAQALERMRALQEQEDNRLLAWFVACDELERWRVDPERALDRHAMVLARPGSLRSRREVAGEVARDFDRGRGVIGAGPLRMQLVEHSDDAVIAAMTQQVESPTGARRVIALITFTSLNLTPLTTNFYGPDTGPAALQPVKDAATAYLATLVAANPEPRTSVWPLVAAGAAIVFLGGAALYWRARRRPA